MIVIEVPLPGGDVQCLGRGVSQPASGEMPITKRLSMLPGASAVVRPAFELSPSVRPHCLFARPGILVKLARRIRFRWASRGQR